MTEYQRLKITGIASDTDLDLATPDDQKPFTVYVDFWQHRDMQFYPVLLIKTSGKTLLSATIRRIVDGKEREYVGRFKTVDSDIDTALVENRMLAYLSGAFGALALGMAAVGLFGLLSYQVATRTSEIGIRMALGAKRGQIQWLVLGTTTLHFKNRKVAETRVVGPGFKCSATPGNGSRLWSSVTLKRSALTRVPLPATACEPDSPPRRRPRQE